MINSNKPTLLELQQWLRWIVTDPRGVSGALAEPHPTELPQRYQGPANDGRSWILEQPAEARLDVYAEAYFQRLVESLASTFPHTVAILGADDFSLLCAEYLKIHPSRTPNIDDVGRDLPDFCNDYLFDLTTAEWNANQSFLGSTLASPNEGSRPELLPEQWSQALLTLEPTLRVQKANWDLLELWQNRVPPAPFEEPRMFALRGFELIPLLSYESKITMFIYEGRRLGEIVDALSDEVEPHQLTMTFAKWMKDRIISSWRV